jgi:hypothetical protein
MDAGCDHAALECLCGPDLEKLLRVLDAELMVSASAGTLAQQRWDSAMADLLVLVEPIQPWQDGSRHRAPLQRGSPAAIVCEAAACGALLYLRNAYRFRPSLMDATVLERHEDLFCEGVGELLGHFEPSAWGALFLALAEHGGRERLSSDAMLLMAILANKGVGVPQDKVLAADLERWAAALANPVGVFCACVSSGLQDYTKAALMGHWTAALYCSRDSDGQFFLGSPKYVIVRVLADQGLLLAAREFFLGGLVNILQGTDDQGRKAWYIVFVKPDSLGDFWSKLRHCDDAIDLTDYCVILSSALGESIPEKEKEKAMKLLSDFCPEKV